MDNMKAVHLNLSAFASHINCLYRNSIILLGCLCR